ncbi:MAG: hypothetical protein AAFX99_16305, partial [Myxococcota bacterium]
GSPGRGHGPPTPQRDQVRRWSDTVWVLHKGRLVACGPSSTTLMSAEVEAVYGVQMLEGGGLGYRLLRREG